jgi:hypothetical protein
MAQQHGTKIPTAPWHAMPYCAVLDAMVSCCTAGPAHLATLCTAHCSTPVNDVPNFAVLCTAVQCCVLVLNQHRSMPLRHAVLCCTALYKAVRPCMLNTALRCVTEVCMAMLPMYRTALYCTAQSGTPLHAEPCCAQQQEEVLRCCTCVFMSNVSGT